MPHSSSRADRGPLGRGHVGRSLERLGRPDVAVLGGDVEVAEHDHLVVRGARRGEPVVQRAEPHEFAVVELGADLTPVRHVDADDADAAARRRDHTRRPRRGRRGRRRTRSWPPRCHARQDGDAVPLALAVVHRLVSQRGERQVREGLVGELGLLQAEHVGAGVAEPLLDANLSGLQRVDVPGRDPHPEDTTYPLSSPLSTRWCSRSASSASRSIRSAGATATRHFGRRPQAGGAHPALEHGPLAEDDARAHLGHRFAVDSRPTARRRGAGRSSRRDRPARRGLALLHRPDLGSCAGRHDRHREPAFEGGLDRGDERLRVLVAPRRVLPERVAGTSP